MSNKKSKTSTVEKSSNGIHIPYDLTVDILSKLPLKSLARFLCVSKLWSSSLVKDIIKARSAQPRILLHFQEDSITYPLNPNETLLYADREGPRTHTLHRGNVQLYAHGLILECSMSNGLVMDFVIYNPTTNQSVSIPRIEYDVNGSNIIDGFFGYDPVENQYKVFCLITSARYGEWSSWQVFTMGSEQWRSINSQDGVFLPSINDGDSVCINGIVYYIDLMLKSVGRVNVRFERVNHISLPETITLGWSRDLSLVNYHGKFGCIVTYASIVCAVMWILEDDHNEKHEWSKITLSTSPRDLFASQFYTFIAGVTRDGEIVIMPRLLLSGQKLFAYFHDPKQNKTRRVYFESKWLKEKQTNREFVCIFSVPDFMVNTLCLCQFNKKRSTIITS